MRHLLTVVEQLDRAARELATDHSINNRLALIFVDNDVELMIHQCCLDHLSYEPLLNRMSPNQRRMARFGGSPDTLSHPSLRQRLAIASHWRHLRS